MKKIHLQYKMFLLNEEKVAVLDIDLYEFTIQNVSIK